jgi:hypothetical protein
MPMELYLIQISLCIKHRKLDTSHYLGIMHYISKYKLNELIKHQLEFISVKVTHHDPSIVYC